MAPKTVKSFLKSCLDIAYTDRDSLKGIFNLSEDEYRRLGDIRAAIQNELGEIEMGDLLEKHKLKYNSSGENEN